MLLSCRSRRSSLRSLRPEDNITLCMCCLFFLQFVLEGTVGGGKQGDIAVDDLTVLDGACETILEQSTYTRNNLIY